MLLHILIAMAADMIGLMHHDGAVLVALVGDAAKMGDDRVVLGQEVAADQHCRTVYRRRLHHDHRSPAPRPLAVIAEMPVAWQAFMAHIDGVGAEDDAVMDQAKTAGAVIVKPAHDTFWGGYAGYFQDPDGHLWEVAWNPQWVVQE